MEMLPMLKSFLYEKIQLKGLLNNIFEKKINVIQTDCNYEYHGSEYGGWFIHPDFLSNQSIVYSLGIGGDISFDLSLIMKFKLSVFAFDPTPKSVEWVKNQHLPENFHFYEYGIANNDGVILFYPPENPDHISHSILPRGTNQKPIEVEVKKFSTITKELGHKRIDILKMDIEGSEYSVIDDILKSNIDIDQILIEFHDRFDGISKNETNNAIKKLNKQGYKIFKISESNQEYSFVKLPIK